MQLLHRVRNKAWVQGFKLAVVVCAVAHAHTGATRIHRHLQVVRGVANHQGALGLHAKLTHQLVQHAWVRLARGFVGSTRCVKQAMQLQLNAERNRRALVREAEGKKQATELDADAQLYAANRQAEAMKVRADAEAYAVSAVAKAISEGGASAVEFEVRKLQAQAVQELSKGSNAKIVLLPSEVVSSLSGGLSGLGGMLSRLATEHGAQLRMGCLATRIDVRQERVCGVQLSTGEYLPADQVLFNGEAAALREGLLGAAPRAAVPAQAPPRSLSAMTWAMHAPLSGVALDRHNVFFCPEYQQEFDDIFVHQRLPRLPTVYVCAQDRPGEVPEGAPERVLALVNAPASGDATHWRDEDLDTCQATTFSYLNCLGLRLPFASPGMRRNSPVDFHRRFPASGGALYGQATHGWTSIFSRPGSRTPVQGLYLAGGSVHPGPGVPMAALSGQLAAEAMLASPVSISRSRPVATSGGT